MAEHLQTQEPRPPAPLRPVNTASALEEITERADTVWTRGGGRPVSVKATERRDLRGPQGRVAIVDGCRTPFVKSGTDFQSMDVIDLASSAASELLARTGIDPTLIDLSVFGVVVPALHAPNLGREVVFRTSMPMRIPGVTVNLACASSTRALTFGASAILSGECDVVLAGGGNDRVSAGDGNDLICAGAGEDVVFAGAGRDGVYGGGGMDRLYGQAGFDRLFDRRTDLLRLGPQ